MKFILLFKIVLGKRDSAERILPRVGNSIFRSFALLLKIAIGSRHSLKKSDCEHIALVAPYKRATVSELLLSFFTKERLERIAFVSLHKREIRANCSCHSSQKRDSSELLLSLFTKERLKWIALVTLHKRETWANCSCHSSQKRDSSELLLSLFTKERLKQISLVAL